MAFWPPYQTWLFLNGQFSQLTSAMFVAHLVVGEMFLSAALAMVLMNPNPPSDAKIVDLKDGFVRVESETYSIEVPKGWKVSRETPWGQRKAAPTVGSGELGVMTAPPGQTSWQSLYRTSLYFIMRDDPEGEATPYKITKGKDGLELCSFSIIAKDGFAYRRYILVKHPSKGLLALNVRIPSKEEEKVWAANFKRMVETAVFK